MTNLTLVYRPGGLVVIDLDSGAVSRPGWLTDGGSSPKTNVTDGQNLYLASGDPGYFGVYNGNTLRTIGAAGVARDYSTAVIAPGGRVWLGGAIPATLEVYNPATDTLTDSGKLDPDADVYQYAYTLAADATHVYVGLGQMPWYLAVYEIATGNVTLHFKDAAYTSGGVFVSLDGETIYYQHPGQWHQLSAGQLTPIASPGVTIRPWYINDTGVYTDISYHPDYEFDMSDAGRYAGHDPVIRWRLKPDGEWQSVTLGDVTTTPQVIRRMFDAGLTDLLALCGEYNPVFTMTDAGVKTVAGLPQYSLYDACRIGDEVYLAGYTAVTLRWNPAEPWTLTATSDHATSNPRKVAGGFGKYHYWLAAGSDGLLYTLANHERDSVGAELGWYDPVTEGTDSLRDPFEPYAPRGLVACGDLIVASADPRAGGSGALLVVDTSTHEVVRTLTPATDRAPALVAVSDADVIGIGENVAYRINVVTGAVVWSIALPGPAFTGIAHYNRRASLDANGFVWFPIGNDLYKLRVSDGQQTRVVTMDAAYTPLCARDEVYLYGQTNIKRLRLPT